MGYNSVADTIGLCSFV